MKIRSAISTFSVAAAVALTIAPVSPAFSGCAYVFDTGHKNVRDTSGHCVKTTSWTKSAWTYECGKPKPKPKPKVVEAPKVTPPPPPPPPKVVKPTVEVVTLQGKVLFPVNSARLSADGKKALDEVIERLRTFDKVKSIVITGHTDSTGSAAYNQKLSERRANAVRDYLISRGVNPALITAIGKGESEPIASNKTRKGRAMNRRVEIQITGTKVKAK